MDAVNTRESSLMKNALSLSRLDHFYLVRVSTVLMILAIIAVHDTACLNPSAYHPVLFLFGVAYPHFVQLAAGRLDGRQFRSRYSFLVDGFFAGAAIPVLSFSPIAATVLATINLFNWVALGGAYLSMLGIVALLAGLGLSGMVEGFSVAGNVCIAVDRMSCGVLLAYFLLVGGTVFCRSTTLQKFCDELQARKDAAEMSWRRAELALMAVLPHGVATEHGNGDIVPRVIGDATLLLADFALAYEEDVGDIGRLHAIFSACDEILARHGLESVKTFGRRYLAITSGQAGPENALVAALEIIAFLKDHGVASNPSKEVCSPHVAIHSGPVVAGLVQPEKFSYDLFGSTVDEIAELVETSATASVLISAAARKRLQRDWRLAPLPRGNGLQAVFTPVEHGRA